MAQDESGSPVVTTEEIIKFMVFVKSAVAEVKEFSEEKKEQTNEISKSIEDVRTCLTDIKIRIERMDTEQTGFMEARRDRTFNCDKIHSDFEQRLRNVPTYFRCGANELRLQGVEKKIESFTPMLYKLVGGVAVLALIVPPVVTAILGYIISFLKDLKKLI